MRTLSHYATVIYDKYFITIGDRGNALSNYNLGGIAKFVGKCFSYLLLGGCVNCTCAVVKDKYAWFFDESTGNTYTLFLTARYIYSTLAEFGIVAIGE